MQVSLTDAHASRFWSLACTANRVANFLRFLLSDKMFCEGISLPLFEYRISIIKTCRLYRRVFELKQSLSSKV